jgi:hypothetical protein
MLKTALAKVLTIKVAAAAIGVAALGGGVALAASGGALPTAASDRAASASHAPAHPTGKPAVTGSQGERAGDAVPSPSLVGLCRAYVAGAGDNPGKALDNPAFGALIAAAGDRSKVAAFCASALKDAPAKSPAAKPDKGATTRPERGPNTRPTPKVTPSHPGKEVAPLAVPDLH